MTRIVAVLATALGACAVAAGTAHAAGTPPQINTFFAVERTFANTDAGIGFTIVNPNLDQTLTGVSFTSTLSPGLVVADPNQVDGDCGGTVTATPGSSSISLTGGTIGQSSVETTGLCTIVADVRAATPGTYSNATDAVDSTETLPGNAAGPVSLDIGLPATLTKSFGADTIKAGDKTTLSFTLTNPNAGVSLYAGGFEDVLPAGLVVAGPNGLTGTCFDGTIQAEPGSGTVYLRDDAILPASAGCTFAVDVTGTAAGIKNNSVAPMSAIDSGSGFVVATGAAARDTISVIGPPGISQAFGAPSIPVNGTTTLTFTLTNPNPAQALSGVGFADALPAGLVVADPSGAATTCGGALSAPPGGSSIALTGAGLAAATSCTVSIGVRGTSTGVKASATGNVTSTEGGAGGTSAAMLTVSGPPVVKIVSPANGALYPVGQAVQANFRCGLGDFGSSITSCTGTTLNGAVLDTRSAGAKTFTATATAADGQVATSTATYRVVAVPPGNRFVLRSIKGSRNGTVSVDMTVPARGRVVVRLTVGRAIYASRTFTLRSARRLRFTLRPNAAGRRLLRSRRSVRLRATISFRPTGGTTRTSRRSVRVGRWWTRP